MTSGIYMMFYGGSIGQNWSSNMPWYVTPKGQLNGVIVGRAMMNYTTSYWIKTIIGDDQAWLLVRSFKVVAVCLMNSCRQLLRPPQTVDVKDTWKIKALGEFVPHVGARKAKSLIWRTKREKGSFSTGANFRGTQSCWIWMPLRWSFWGENRFSEHGNISKVGILKIW